MPAHKKGNKNRKYGRNKIKCERYRREHRREKNKIRQLRTCTPRPYVTKRIAELERQIGAPVA